jgi:hypothetical protein
MKKAIMIAAALMTATPAHGSTTMQNNGNGMLSDCTNDSIFHSGVCLGYIQGIYASVNVMMAMSGKGICYPEQVTLGQIRDVVISYLRRNPQSRHENSVLLYMKAVTEAWRCK